MKLSWYVMVAITAVCISSGCAIKTYEIQQDRPDQNLASGNRGTLKGDVPRDDIKDRKTTRQVKVIELDLFPSQKSPAHAQAPETVPPEAAAPVAPAAPVVPVFEEYKVKDADTLQKIARNFYGSINQWSRIYDANRDVLRSPDSIYPGQTLKIPVTEKTK